MFAASADKGIDLVSNPVIFEKNGEERACQQEYPTAASPDSGKGRVLPGNVHEVGGAVTGVRQQSQDDEEK